MRKLYLDSETASRADLTDVDTVRYAKHRSTYVQVWGYAMDGGLGRFPDQGWFTQHDIEHDPEVRKALTDAANDNDVVFVAHNAFFDRLIWKYHMHKRLGYPDVPIERWRCTMAKAFKYGLPGRLKMLAQFLELETQKDMEGHTSMLALSRPLKKPVYSCHLHMQPHNKPCCEHAVKYDFHTPQHYPQLFAKHYSYCLTDVLAMKEADELIPDLSPRQQRIWQMDQRLNERGVRLDIPLVEKAVNLVGEYRAELTGEYLELTDHTHRPSQRKELAKWLEKQDVDVPNTKKTTLQPLLYGGRVSSDVGRVIEIVLATNKTSLAKYMKMEQLADAQHILTNLIQYHAAHTGRWGGRGVQPQNLPRPTFKDVATILFCIEVCSYDVFKTLYGDRTAEALACALRAMIIARLGMHFKIGDYRQVEARITSWLAGQDWKLNWFAAGVDTYCKAAEPVYGYEVDPSMKTERQTGKACELGLGFGGGIAALVNTARSNGVDLSVIAMPIVESATAAELSTAKYCSDFYYRTNEETVDTTTALACDIIKQRWRAANPEIVDMWQDIEDAAVAALENPGKGNKYYCCGERVHFYVNGPFLICKLPSGNFIAYFKPILHEDTRGNKYFSYKTPDWKIPRKTTYGGSLTENIVQAVAYDIMSWSMVVLEDEGFTPALTVHDEIITEDDDSDTSTTLSKFEEIMRRGFKWTAGLPIDVEVQQATRYGK